MEKPNTLHLPAGFPADERRLEVVYNGRILAASGHFEDDKGDFEICDGTVRFLLYSFKIGDLLQVIARQPYPRRLVYRAVAHPETGSPMWEHVDDTDVW